MSDQEAAIAYVRQACGLFARTTDEAILHLSAARINAFLAGLAHARGEVEQDASAEFVKHTDTLLALMKSRADLGVSEECMKRLNAAAIAAIEQTKGE